MQLELGLVSEIKTKTYDIHARKTERYQRATKHGGNTGKRKHMLVLLGFNVESLHN